ncbi:anhydro-N-acetylmuramic acid kinase [Allopseudospirillum japonicum]|uniref:Anhydro-N-acetylmuramic acid kinase n=1 Tax=Allopseudospirillum japonicum TaxID=64971 RepID=A0A1H6U278_9GAMM|nr:anhydro-N-acetylmuramic acid kinase [Allopseudospirillum japonicum]SEI82062.1 anhydro-N-acetylmuramic acid kinase [Allopseudospirillum japonicum]
MSAKAYAGYYIGLMSGTSLDGVDAALIDCDPHTGIRLVATHYQPYPESLKQALLEVCHSPSIHFQTLATLEYQLALSYADTVNELLDQHSANRLTIQAIGCHGQTVEHQPSANPGFSYQLVDPNVLAEMTGISVVSDFRRRDLAAGGQGAPLTPALHAYLFQEEHQDRLVLNLGGFANLTWLPAKTSQQAILGFDTGPANVLLDTWYQKHHPESGHACDIKGDWAAQGQVINEIVATALQDAYFARPLPKTTGREYFNPEWLNHLLIQQDFIQAAPVDIQASLSQLTAVSIAHAIKDHLAKQMDLSQPIDLYVCGGGVHNQDLMRRLQKVLAPMKIHVKSTQALGLDPDWVEAVTFAWLAYQTLNRQPANLPSVTGAGGPRILGGIYWA